MIENEKQYQVTKAQIILFREAIENMKVKVETDKHPLLRESQIAGLEGVLKELVGEVRDYERRL